MQQNAGNETYWAKIVCNIFWAGFPRTTSGCLFKAVMMGAAMDPAPCLLLDALLFGFIRMQFTWYKTTVGGKGCVSVGQDEMASRVGSQISEGFGIFHIIHVGIQANHDSSHFRINRNRSVIKDGVVIFLWWWFSYPQKNFLHSVFLLTSAPQTRMPCAESSSRIPDMPIT